MFSPVVSKLFVVCFLFFHVTAQQCRYVTVPVCDGESVAASGNGIGGLKGDKGERGYPGKPGPPGLKGDNVLPCPIGQKGDIANIEELQAHLSAKLNEVETTLATLLLPPNCASSSVVGYQQLRSGEFAYCDGGWTVFQKRFDGSIEFQRGWNDYKQGFGNFSTEFWLGLEKIHKATRGRGCRLRIDLWGFDGDHAFAEYSAFSIEGESDDYRLHVGGYSGTAGDSLIGWNNGMAFTTKDRDNDRFRSQNCAYSTRGSTGGWWFEACGYSQLNAAWGPSTGSYRNNLWYYWKGSDVALNGSIMKLRCD